MATNILQQRIVPVVPKVLSNERVYVYVPKALVGAYKSATNWSTYANQIRAIEDYPDITGGSQ